MPNPQAPSQPTSTGKPATSPSNEPTVADDNRLSQSQADSVGSQSQRQQSKRDVKQDRPDKVEIGDPVPPDDRTIKAGDGSDDLPGADDDGGHTVNSDPEPSSERH